jgi:hypothetical protein
MVSTSGIAGRFRGLRELLQPEDRRVDTNQRGEGCREVDRVGRGIGRTRRRSARIVGMAMSTQMRVGVNEAAVVVGVVVPVTQRSEANADHDQAPHDHETVGDHGKRSWLRGRGAFHGVGTDCSRIAAFDGISVTDPASDLDLPRAGRSGPPPIDAARSRRID